MTATAKVFTTGNSQAVRLPKAFRLDAKEVWISRNEATGEIVLRPRLDERARRCEIEDLIREIREAPVTDDFIPPRDDAYRPDPFADDGSDA
jgi:antitoxin VapB